MINILLTSIIFALPLYLFRFTVAGVPTNVFEVVLYAAFLAWLLFRWQKGRSSTSSDNNYSLSEGRPKSKGYHINWRLPWVVWAWVAVGLIAALTNPDVPSGLGYWRAYFVDGAIVYLIIANEFESARTVVPRALIVVGGVVSIISLAGFWGWHVAGDGRWLGWFGYDVSASPNYLSLFLAPIVALSTLAIFFWRGWWRYLALASVLVTTVALWGSQSRGAAVGIIGGIVIALIYYACRKKQKHTWVYLSGLALIIIAATTFYIAKPNAAASPADGRVATSNNIRWEIWKTSAEISKNKPIFGVGLGNYQNYFTELTKGRVNYPEFISPLALTAHNLYLQILTTMGVVGLIIFVWWMVIIIKAISISEHKSETTIIAAALASTLLYGLVDTPYFKNDLAILWWVLVAMITIYGKESKKFK